MNINTSWYTGSRLSLSVGIVGASVGLILGILAGLQPLLLCLAIAAVILVICFFTYFEQTVLGLLILRSSLDVFSAQQVPAAFAIGLDGLTILYVVLMLLLGQRVITDKFFWFFAAWVAVQGLWVVLLPLGGLGLDASYLPVSIREWVRLFSWLMVYLLVMQLRGRIDPEKLVSWLFMGLSIPLVVALLQVILPVSALPPFLIYGGDASDSLPFEVGSRLNGTLGHPNAFATFLLFFIGLTYWKLSQSNRRLPLIFLLGTLIFFIVSTKALFIMGMLGIFLMILIAPRLNLLNLLGGIILLAIALGIYASSEFGLERLSSILDTPLLNPDIDISQSILLSWKDNNSFNWRIAQWTFLLNAWQKCPLLGYGLHSSSAITVFNGYAHNDYIRALAETGIGGLVTFLLFLIAQFSRLFNLFWSAPPRSSQRQLCAVLIAIFMAMLVGMLTENIWSHTTLFFYWWTSFAVAGWNWNKQQSSLELVYSGFT